MKKIIMVGAVAALLAGCANTGPNQAIGTGVGAVGGYGVARALGAGPGGAAAGAVAGALLGNAVGQSMDQQQQQVYTAPPPRRVYVQERYVPVCRIERVYDRYYNVYRERRVCR